jgi:DNA oxidative demethylase
MVTPGGFVMSVAMTNCGSAGWITDRTGYRYDRLDPESGQPWPALPDAFLATAINAAREVSNPGFVPDACLINPYAPGARLSLHQERNECDFKKSIVSVSLGLTATSPFGGIKRSDPVRRYVLRHGVLPFGAVPRSFAIMGCSRSKRECTTGLAACGSISRFTACCERSRGSDDCPLWAPDRRTEFRGVL